MSFSFDPTMAILNRALDGSALRQKTIANNIANLNTPGYKSRSVDFEDQLKSALADPESSEDALDGFKPTVTVDNSTDYRTDGNNVDVDSEMARLAENQLYYSAITTLLNKKLSILKSVISEGKR